MKQVEIGNKTMKKKQKKQETCELIIGGGIIYNLFVTYRGCNQVTYLASFPYWYKIVDFLNRYYDFYHHADCTYTVVERKMYENTLPANYVRDMED
jgi:hypothetical protein